MRRPSDIESACSRWLGFALLLISLPNTLWAIGWPQEVPADGATIVVYQPQPEKLQGDRLTGRAAMALEIDDRDEPVFGAMWFEARIVSDRDAGIVTVREFKVTRVSWPDSKDAGEQTFTRLVEDAMPDAGFEISLERLSASLKTADVEARSLANLKTDPPAIEFRNKLAVLLLYDGDPRFSPVENSSYERALNTPFLVVRNTSTQRSYLSGGSQWYQSNDPLGPWAPTESPPADLLAMLPAADADITSPAVPPEIVVATKPTELISTDGDASWKSLPGAELLYVENTENPWLRELSTGNMYLLLSGRWFRSKTQSGPWSFVRADELPASFADIPPESDIGGLRSSVAGTDEADDALLDMAIPQTAAVSREDAALTVEYDGTPQFKNISGTTVARAVNTGAQVLEISNRYYAVDNGVWFTSGDPQGPWIVADSIPTEEIQQIPPDSPVYNTTYVQIYSSTPEVVYVGYTPGYLWSFPYYGVPVYGTGYYYPPYWGSYYYPRPPTWGLHVGYNPWTGWNFGVSWSNGFMSVGMSWGGGWGGAYRPWGCCGGFYGGGYRRPIHIHTGDINIGNNVNIGNRARAENRIAGDNNLRTKRDQSRNIYDRPSNRTRNASPALARGSEPKARPAVNRPNNVYADKNGSVARRTESGSWESRSDGGWKRDQSSGSSLSSKTRPATATQPAQNRQPKPSTSYASNTNRQSLDRSGLNQSYSARQSGASRARTSSMHRGGGGRRR